MIPTQLRAKAFAAGAKVEKHSLRKMPLFTFLDFFRFQLLGWKKAVRLMGYIQRYRRNLSNPSWECLTAFYPRPTYLLYYYLLFWWARYIGVLEDLIHNPDKSLVAELFIRYIIEIDAVIDDPQQVSKVNNPDQLKKMTSANLILGELLSLVRSLGIPDANKRDIFKFIGTYRRDCLSICQRAVMRKSNSLSSIYNDKDNTAGMLFHVWAKILCQLYLGGVSSDLARSSGEILQQAGMAIQVVDDMMDFPIDHSAKVPNLFYEMLKETPKELQKAFDYLGWIDWAHMDVEWTRANLPITCSKAAQTMDGILEKISDISIKPEISSELVQMIGLFSRLGFGSSKPTVMDFDKSSVY